MLLHLRRALLVSLVFLGLLGLAYPLAVTGISQLAFHYQAQGSIGPNGSTLIGQSWTGPRWFQGRPDGSVLTLGPGKVIVSGTNQPGPLSAALEHFVAERAAVLKKEGVVPTEDLVTTSGSLVDPDILPMDAYAQVAAVAHARHLSVGVLRRLVASQVQTRPLGFLGSDYIDVLQLNEALAKLR